MITIHCITFQLRLDITTQFPPFRMFSRITTQARTITTLPGQSVLTQHQFSKHLPSALSQFSNVIAERAQGR